MNHSEWKTRRTKRLLGEGVEESSAYVEAGHALALGQAVYDRRITLGISQAELARRADMTQPQISNIEGGDSMPTLALLTRLAEHKLRIGVRADGRKELIALAVAKILDDLDELLPYYDCPRHDRPPGTSPALP